MKNRASSKSGLFLMELIIAILFFSLSGAICVQLFVNSHLTSQKSVELNHAVEWCQNMAEAFYGCNGNMDEMMLLFTNSYKETSEETSDTFYLDFDQDFLPLERAQIQSAGFPAQYVYKITVNIQEENEMLICRITTCKADETVYELEVYLFPKKEVSHAN